MKPNQLPVEALKGAVLARCDCGFTVTVGLDYIWAHHLLVNHACVLNGKKGGAPKGKRKVRREHAE